MLNKCNTATYIADPPSMGDQTYIGDPASISTNHCNHQACI